MSETQAIQATLQVPDIDWVTIPAGEFIYGEDSEQTTHYLETFQIARYPVTNAQYQCFIDDGGYENDHWWQGLEKPEIEESEWPQGNRPRTNVNWYEATAFTRWLSDRLNQLIRLPSEQEWEKAARGERGLKYPWGDGYEAGNANVRESGGSFLEQTIGVGLYPRDKSPKGVKDMAGNVVEWCNEMTADVNDNTQNSSPTPVLRGGAWSNDPDDARAANRHRGGVPDFRDYDVGFRLLRSPPS